MSAIIDLRNDIRDNLRSCITDLIISNKLSKIENSQVVKVVSEEITKSINISGLGSIKVTLPSVDKIEELVGKKKLNKIMRALVTMIDDELYKLSDDNYYDC
jgi:hypothetical protein